MLLGGLVAFGCFNGGDSDGKNLVSFLMERNEQFRFDQGKSLNDFHPIDGLIALFFNDAKLGGKFCFRSRPSGGAVVGSDGSAASDKLRRNGVS